MANKDFLDRCTSLAILGGSFDPIHHGHIAVAEAVLNQFKPQRVLFMPAGKQPHKLDKKVTQGKHRYQMVLQSICNTPGLDVSKMELERKGPSYTVDTLREIKSICPKGCKIYLIVGQDALEGLPNWHKPKELLSLCEIITVPRPGHHPGKLESKVREIAKKYSAKINILNMPALDISSTYIRSCIKEDMQVGGLMPPPAIEYAHRHGLYKAPKPDLGNKHYKWAKAKIKQRLTPRRYKHTLGVVIAAEKLAAHYGADVNQARWAALLHDCTKEYGAEKKRILCQQWGIATDPIVESHIDLAHGLLGAESARRHFYIEDEVILQAIRYHIMGNKNMGLLDKIIVLADFIEPYREDYYPLKQMRERAYVDINQAVALGITAMREVDGARGKELHHWSADAIESLKGQ